MVVSIRKLNFEDLKHYTIKRIEAVTTNLRCTSQRGQTYVPSDNTTLFAEMMKTTISTFSVLSSGNIFSKLYVGLKMK